MDDIDGVLLFGTNACGKSTLLCHRILSLWLKQDFMYLVVNLNINPILKFLQGS